MDTALTAVSLSNVLVDEPHRPIIRFDGVLVDDGCQRATARARPCSDAIYKA